MEEFNKEAEVVVVEEVKQKKLQAVNPVPTVRTVKVEILSGIRRGAVLIKHGIEFRWLPVIEVPDIKAKKLEITEERYNQLVKTKWSK